MSQTLIGRPVHKVFVSKQGPAGPAGPSKSGLVTFAGPALVLDASHAGKVVALTASTPQTVTVNAGIWPDHEMAVFMREGAGDVTFIAGAGVTIRSEAGRLGIAAQDGQVALYYMGADYGDGNQFRLAGRLA